MEHSNCDAMPNFVRSVDAGMRSMTAASTTQKAAHPYKRIEESQQHKPNAKGTRH